MSTFVFNLSRPLRYTQTVKAVLTRSLELLRRVHNGNA